MDPNPKQQVVETLKQANNVLVTVSANPSVDQLSAAIGLTLLLNKLNKHATAVFSGEVPSTMEFLRPEDTIEKNTDSLRDFIISLDKSKADKLRYKVEENIVKIFITPYRTNITEADLNFSQGDFNVDAVVALGVDNRDHLDQAISAHGRILHDAAVIGVAAGTQMTDLGAINWVDPAASSLSEMLVSISEAFQGGLIDAQMATAFLTGIVAETDRFKNEKTSPKVMTMAAQLMAAGANQQLIATELQSSAIPPVEEPVPPPVEQPPAEEAPPTDDDQPAQAEGTIDLHAEPTYKPVYDERKPAEEAAKPQEASEIHIDEEGRLRAEAARAEEQTVAKGGDQDNYIDSRRKVIQPPPGGEQPTAEPADDSHGRIMEPPDHGGTLTANSVPEHQQYGGTTDPLSTPSSSSGPMLSHDAPPSVLPPVADSSAVEPPHQNDESQTDDDDEQTLADLEKRVGAHQGQPTEPSVPSLPLPDPSTQPVNAPTMSNEEAARQAVQGAITSAPYDPNHPEPIQALNAQPMDLNPSADDAAAPPADVPATPPPLGPPPMMPPIMGSGQPPPPPPVQPQQ